MTGRNEEVSEGKEEASVASGTNEPRRRRDHVSLISISAEEAASASAAIPTLVEAERGDWFLSRANEEGAAINFALVAISI